MVDKGQWVVLPYLVDKQLLWLSLSPPGVKEERDQLPQWLGDNGLSNLYSKTLPISTMSAMQYGRTLDRLIIEVVIAYPEVVPGHVLKADISDVFTALSYAQQTCPI